MAPLTRNKNNGNNKLRAKRSGNNKTPSIVQGKRKSGKVWKDQKQRAGSIRKVTKVAQNRASKKITSTLAKALKQEIVAEKTSKRLSEQAKRELKLANERRSEISQKIQNPKKLKAIKKQNRRTIQKREDPPSSRSSVRNLRNRKVRSDALTKP